MGGPHTHRGRQGHTGADVDVHPQDDGLADADAVVLAGPHGRVKQHVRRALEGGEGEDGVLHAHDAVPLDAEDGPLERHHVCQLLRSKEGGGARQGAILKNWRDM